MSDDRTLLEQAARAAGIEVWRGSGHQSDMLFRAPQKPSSVVAGVEWSPLKDDGDAFRLAVALSINIVPNYYAEWHTGTGETFRAGREFTTEAEPSDPLAATRRAIVRSAAKIGAVPCAEEGR